MISINSAQDRTILFDLLPLQDAGLPRLRPAAPDPGRARPGDVRGHPAPRAQGRGLARLRGQLRGRPLGREHPELPGDDAEPARATASTPSTMPLVLQYNKRDLPQVMETEVMDRALNARQGRRDPRGGGARRGRARDLRGDPDAHGGGPGPALLDPRHQGSHARPAMDGAGARRDVRQLLARPEPAGRAGAASRCGPGPAHRRAAALVEPRTHLDRAVTRSAAPVVAPPAPATRCSPSGGGYARRRPPPAAASSRRDRPHPCPMPRRRLPAPLPCGRSCASRRSPRKRAERTRARTRAPARTWPTPTRRPRPSSAAQVGELREERDRRASAARRPAENAGCGPGHPGRQAARRLAPEPVLGAHGAIAGVEHASFWLPQPGRPPRAAALLNLAERPVLPSRAAVRYVLENAARGAEAALALRRRQRATWARPWTGKDLAFQVAAGRALPHARRPAGDGRALLHRRHRAARARDARAPGRDLPRPLRRARARGDAREGPGRGARARAGPGRHRLPAGARGRGELAHRRCATGWARCADARTPRPGSSSSSPAWPPRCRGRFPRAARSSPSAAARSSASRLARGAAGRAARGRRSRSRIDPGGGGGVRRRRPPARRRCARSSSTCARASRGRATPVEVRAEAADGRVLLSVGTGGPLPAGGRAVSVASRLVPEPGPPHRGAPRRHRSTAQTIPGVEDWLVLSLPSSAPYVPTSVLRLRASGGVVSRRAPRAGRGAARRRARRRAAPRSRPPARGAEARERAPLRRVRPPPPRRRPRRHRPSGWARWGRRRLRARAPTRHASGRVRAPAPPARGASAVRRFRSTPRKPRARERGTEREPRGRAVDIATTGAARSVARRRGSRTQVLDDVAARPLVPPQHHDPAALSVLEQVGEGAEAVVGLVERGLLALHGLLDHGAPEDLLVLALQGHDRVHEQREALLQLLGRARDHRHRPLLHPDEVLVEDELVAVLDEQVGGRVLDPEPDHVLVVLLELADEGREVRVARARPRSS